MFENIDIEKSLKTAQTSLLVMILLTIVNVAGLLIGGGLYLPYSAIIPYAIVFFSETITIEIITISLLFVGFYVGVGVMSQNKPIWLIGALVMYTIDTLVLFFFFFNYGFDIVRILELLFHGWILISLFKGSVAAYKDMIA